MKFIHAADIHLDSPLTGLSAYDDAPVAMLRTATREAFTNLVNEAIEQNVDFMVIAGDLYDGTWKDHNTGIYFCKQMGRLTANANLKPLMERAGVNSNTALAEAITRSDEHRHHNADANNAKANLLEGGDGLEREQLEREVDESDLGQLGAELSQLEKDLSDAVQRQTRLSGEQANAITSLAQIGGSNAAASAEAQRQEALARMSDAAERYVKVYAAGRLLRWAIDRYREEKQGPMLTRAGSIVSKVTLGSFQKLVVDFDTQPMALEGQRSDGTLVGISGMSDGTADQPYLALRLAALELHLEQALPLPFIADDLFINYDDDRSKAGLEALAALSEQTQVIFLSHHDHLVPVVHEMFGKQVNVVTL